MLKLIEDGDSSSGPRRWSLSEHLVMAPFEPIIKSGPTLKVESNVGITLSESVASIAAVIATILNRGVGDFQCQGERVFA